MANNATRFDPTTLTLWIAGDPVHSIELMDGSYFVVYHHVRAINIRAYTLTKQNAMEYQLALYRAGRFETPSHFGIEILRDHEEDIDNVYCEAN